jgi:signal transduction histidine kinase
MLRLARRRLEPELLDQAARELDAGLQELREIARGIHPAILTDRGLRAALDALAARLPVPIEIEIPDESLPDEVEATIYYIVSEALTNVARHAEAGQARVTVARDAGLVRCEVADDGRGGADMSRGTGILGLRDRAEAAGGTLRVVSAPGSGTVVAATLPAVRWSP